MKAIPNKDAYERILNENARSDVEQLKAIQDYNIMMGLLADPEDEEYGEWDEEDNEDEEDEEDGE